MLFQKGGFQKKIIKYQIKKSDLGKNLCGASCLYYLGLPIKYVNLAIKITRNRESDDLPFEAMDFILNKYENNLRKKKSKKIIEDFGKSRIKQYDILFDSDDHPLGIEGIILEISNSIKTGFNKVIGLYGIFYVVDKDDEVIEENEWGHYVIIGKNKNNIYLINIEENKTYLGIENIIGYLFQSWTQGKGVDKIRISMMTDTIFDYTNGLAIK